MSETATCRDCGHEFEYEPCDSPLLANFTPRICDACGQKALKVEAAQEREERRIERNIPPRYAAATFESFRPKTKMQRRALEITSKYARDGVFLLGPPGCGKTHLACAAIASGPVGSLFVGTTELLEDIREGFNNDNRGLFVSATVAPLLALDDLGSEIATDFVRDRLYALLNARWNRGMPMIVTSNCRPAEIERRIGAAGASRLAMCRYRIEITGPDGRRGLQVAS